MMIIGKSEKDYYDGVVGTVGIDKSIIYDRKYTELTRKELLSIHDKLVNRGLIKNKQNVFNMIGGHNIHKEQKKNYGESSQFIVGFCGKLYVGWKFYSEIKEQFSTKLVTTISYDIDIVKTIVDLNDYNKGLEKYNYIMNYDPIELFREFNAPIFIYDTDFNKISISKWVWSSSGYDSKFLINPNLNKYLFYRVFDSFQAFQEIQMFIGGVLTNNEDKVIKVDDKQKAQQHGFDKWSFRKEKQ